MWRLVLQQVPGVQGAIGPSTEVALGREAEAPASPAAYLDTGDLEGPYLLHLLQPQGSHLPPRGLSCVLYVFSVKKNLLVRNIV